MSYYVGDDSTITYPVTSQTDPAQPVDLAPDVRAFMSDGTTNTITGSWEGAAATTRNLHVPLGTLTAGLWSLRLVIDNEPDLFLGNVYVE